MQKKTPISLLLFVSISVFTHISLYSQNLISNGSFENFIVAPNDRGQVERSVNWDSLKYSPDFMHATYQGWQPQLGQANTGNGFFGIWNLNNFDGGEAFGQQPLIPLERGKSYEISLFTKLTQQYPSGINEYSNPCGGINVYGIDKKPTSWNDNQSQDNLGAELLWTSNVISEYNWTEQDGCFIPKAKANYLFFILENNGETCSQYVFLDDIVIKEKKSNLNIDDTLLCIGDSVLLEASEQGATFLWNDGSINDTLIAKESGIYWVEVTNGICKVRDSIFINHNPYLGNDTSFCDGESITLSVTTPSVSVIWQDGSTSLNFSTQTPGQFWVEVTLGDCSITDTIDIEYKPELIIDLGEDRKVCDGTIAKLNVYTPEAIYLWQDGSTNSSIEVESTGLYSVTVSTPCEQVSDEINLTFDNCDCNVYFPSAFSPNRDFNNDSFSPLSDCDVTYILFEIFDRWGNKIFQSIPPQIAWNGRINGELAQEGVYTFHLTYLNRSNKQESLGGKFTLLR